MENTTVPQAVELKCETQTNVWGKVGSDSLVATFAAASDPDFVTEATETYAELWMGTHHKHPALVKVPGCQDMTLSAWLADHPDQLGQDVVERFGRDLPFLFKVLSVRHVLSLQIHPDQELAKKLHASQPELYTTPMHKPEMDVALTPCVTLAGFRSISQLAIFLEEIPELRSLLGESGSDVLAENCEDHCEEAVQDRLMRSCFRELLLKDSKAVAEKVNQLAIRLKENVSKGLDVSAIDGDVFLEVNETFPGDRGCMAVFLLNVLRLAPGEAIFVDTLVPHALVRGDCIEVLIQSDNIVRGGFSHKHCDVTTMYKMADCSSRLALEPRVKGVVSVDTAGVTVTRFPQLYWEFGLTRYDVPSGLSEFTVEEMTCGSVCLVTQGTGQLVTSTGHCLDLKIGKVFFLSANARQVIISKSTDAANVMVLFRAHVSCSKE